METFIGLCILAYAVRDAGMRISESIKSKKLEITHVK